ncbi:acyl-CoA dehydrogenase family protein [Pseudarthrobacter sp. efr-133-R2A-89]|uniref:acyl-CoA dehydrogenase family protein n=1 Tax=Pseudarthrobacter sp. efr-133-R2A-89 TaxID=3040302 RepID=UPI002555921A|nr:acyl-CoA dehydrogenase family protein [Pseudarthrobacter sp. efr-133-R2A-89]
MPAETTPVLLDSTAAGSSPWSSILREVPDAAGDVTALLALAVEAGETWPRPGAGRTPLLWELLASVAAIDVAAARVFEPHLDAIAILSQAAGTGTADQPAAAGDGVGASWGVFAAEAPGVSLQARRDGGAVVLEGAKPWCSLAASLDRAVITAHTDDGGRAAFAVDLHHAGVRCEEPAWVARGLREIPSGTVHFDQVPAVALGGTGWYHSRPGFAWGGMGVAACWLGGAVGVARDFRAGLLAGADAGREPDQVALAALGEVDRTLTAAMQYLARTAARIDDGSLGAAGQSTWSGAQRVRGTVAAAVERVLHLVLSNRGPAPLAFDERYAKRTADLGLYVRQHHGSRDDAQLGRLTLKGDCPW